MQRFWDAIERFMSVKLKKESSRAGYRSRFLDWCRFLGAIYGTSQGYLILTNATGDDVERFIQELRTRKGQKSRTPGADSALTDATIHSKLIAIKSIYNFLVKKEFLKKNPVTQADFSLAPFMNRKRPTKALPYELVEPLILAIGQQDKTMLRDRAYLSLCFAGGLRRSEVCEIRISNIKRTATGIFSINLLATKSLEDQEQAIAPFATPYIQDYLLQRVAENATPEDYLFAWPSGKPYCYHLLYQRFKVACERTGINPKDFSPHSARATAITKLLDDGLSHREVKEFSRHKSVTTVEVYDKKLRTVQNSPAVNLKFSVNG